MMLININKEFNLWYYYSNFSFKSDSKGETGTSCHTELVVKKLITQSIYTNRKFFFYTVDCWRNINL